MLDVLERFDLGSAERGCGTLSTESASASWPLGCLKTLFPVSHLSGHGLPAFRV